MAEKQLDQNFDFKIKLASAIESIKWFKKLVVELRGKKSRELTQQEKLEKDDLLQNNKNTVNRLEVGKMYLFYYDPKGRDELPYYDTLPLVLITDLHKSGFNAINLHYLPVEHRMVLLSNLQQKAVYKDGKLERLNISYGKLDVVQEFQLFRPCFKQYLYSRIRSKIKIIPTDDWGFAASLPLETFKKQTKQQIWKESLATQNMTL